MPTGTGFKTAPVIGDILAEMVLSGRCARYDLRPFSAGRFSTSTLTSKL